MVPNNKNTKEWLEHKERLGLRFDLIINQKQWINKNIEQPKRMLNEQLHKPKTTQTILSVNVEHN